MALTRIPNYFDLPGDVGAGTTFVTSSLDLSEGTVYPVTLSDVREFDIDTNDNGYHTANETISLDGGAITTQQDGLTQVVTANLTLEDGSVITWEDNIRILPLENGEYLWYLSSVPEEYQDAVIESIEIVSSRDGDSDSLGYYAPYSIDLRNGVVEGSDESDYIDESYSGDPGGDYVDNNDNTGEGVDAGGVAGSNDDLIEAYGGDDTVLAGLGNDTVDGGGGSDSIDGGDGDDLIHGGQTVPDADLHLNWASAGADEEDLSAGFVQDTGGINVEVSFTNDGNDGVISAESTTTQYVGTGEPFDPNSAATLGGGAAPGDTSTTTIAFSSVDRSVYADEVVNVSFRLNDLDQGAIDGFEDIVTIRAYDADGNLLDVTITYQGSTTTGTAPTEDGEGSWSASDSEGSVLVEIDGPVSYIEIDYDNGGYGGQSLHVTDVHFTAVGSTDGGDIILGGTGDDTIDGGAGNDSIWGGQGNDSILGSEGNDQIAGDDGLSPGIGGNDTIDGGDGDDDISGDAGDDLIYGGGGHDTIVGDEGNFSEVVGHDTIYGGDGNDEIYADAGDDLVFGEGGDDLISADTGNDTVDGGDGHDEIYTWTGDDVVDGGTGDDYIDSGAGHDSVLGGTGNDFIQTFDGDDTVFAGDDNDTVYAGDGNDTVDGGLGSDSVDGGAGNDTLSGGGGGSDTLTGGSGDDLFIISGGAGDEIFLTDFGAGETDGVNGISSDNDYVDLTPWYNDDTLDAYNQANGTSFGTPLGALEHDAADGQLQWIAASGGPSVSVSLTGTGAMDTEHTGVVCFAAGTLIKTRHGEIPVESLKCGDLVLTLDQGYQPVRWVGHRHLSESELRNDPQLRPVRIRAGALGPKQPDRDLLVSPQHRIMIGSNISERMFGTREVLVPAKDLLEIDGIDVVESIGSVDYWHFFFASHQVVFSNSVRTESLYPGKQALRMVGAEAREEIFSIFPQFREFFEGTGTAVPARKLVRGRKARRLATRHAANSKFVVSSLECELGNAEEIAGRGVGKATASG